MNGKPQIKRENLNVDKLLGIYHRLLNDYGHHHWWPGETPFEIMIGAILTQNTAWANVEKAIVNLKSADLLDVERLLNYPQPQLAELLRPSGYFNLKSSRVKNFCQFLIQHGGIEGLGLLNDADLRELLLSVNGIGPETADDMMLYAFERPVFVIDAYTRRIFSRLGLISGSEVYEELRQLFETNLPEDVALYNDYHAQIVFHAKQACKKKPDCLKCCLQDVCNQSLGGLFPAPWGV